jgi:hypothetical protein
MLPVEVADGPVGAQQGLLHQVLGVGRLRGDRQRHQQQDR